MKPIQEVETVFNLLKTHLKTRKLSYAVLAKRLHMSESNLKRIFSTQSCSFEQMSRLCEAAGASLFELITTASQKQVLSFQLDDESIRYFMRCFDGFVFFRKLCAAKNPNDLLQGASKYLRDLEKLKLIRRSDRGIEILVTGYLDLRNAPKLAALVKEKWIPWFFSRVLGNTERNEYQLRAVSTGLSQEHRLQFIAELDLLLGRYREIGYRDQQINSREFFPFAVCVGIGPHRVGAFEDEQPTDATFNALPRSKFTRSPCEPEIDFQTID